MHTKIPQRGTESAQGFYSTKDLGQTMNLSLDRPMWWGFSVQKEERPIAWPLFLPSFLTPPPILKGFEAAR